jgi:hypothetical protein
MPQISLAKALKLKNRLAGRLNKVQQDIQTYNSVLTEQANQVDVPALCKLRDEIADNLVTLKTKIVFGNAEIQADLIRQGELKSKLTWLATLETRDGKERHGYQNTEVTWVASVKKKDVDQETKKLEAEIDAIQDKLDTYNHTKKIEVSDQALNLAS